MWPKMVGDRTSRQLSVYSFLNKLILPASKLGEIGANTALVTSHGYLVPQSGFRLPLDLPLLVAL